MTTPKIYNPPSNFLPSPSKIYGISVYAPRVDPPEQQDSSEYKCPHCGATTGFDVTAGSVACEHCGYKALASTEAVGHDAKTSEFTLEALSRYARGWGTPRRILHCNSCGGEISVAEGALSVTCSFCASNEITVRSSDVSATRPGFLIPFKNQPKENLSILRNWLSKGWFHPENLNNLISLDKFIGIYLPFWTFDAHMEASWKAELGYERQERYYDGSSKEWKTRTEIDWVWKSGFVPLTIEDMLVIGSSHISRRITEHILPFSLDDLVPYSADYLAGWQAQSYDIDLPAGWETGKAMMRESVKNACYKNMDSSHVRNFSMNADFSNEAWRYVLLPVYLSSYKYDNKIFQVMVNGQNGVIAGQKPVAWWKIWSAIAAMFSPGVLLGLIGLLLMVIGGIGIVPLVIGLVFLFIALFLSIALYRKALDSEAP